MIQIVFQNEHFVVCNKPSLVLSVPGREKNDRRLCLGLELQNTLGKKIFPVHRLDFEVSGLIIYALNAEAHRSSQKWFENKKITKLYHATTATQDFAHWPEIVETDRSKLDLTVQKKFFWTSRIQRGKKRSFLAEYGDWSETEAEVMSFTDTEVFWRLSPLTGRSHQLRLELSRRGFPIKGDSLYGSKTSFEPGGIALKAVELKLSGIKNSYGLPEKLAL